MGGDGGKKCIGKRAVKEKWTVEEAFEDFIYNENSYGKGWHTGNNYEIVDHTYLYIGRMRNPESLFISKRQKIGEKYVSAFETRFTRDCVAKLMEIADKNELDLREFRLDNPDDPFNVYSLSTKDGVRKFLVTKRFITSKKDKKYSGLLKDVLELYTVKI